VYKITNKINDDWLTFCVQWINFLTGILSLCLQRP